MTCKHVVEGAIRFTFRTPTRVWSGGAIQWTSPGRVDWGSQAADCALVRFVSPDRPRLLPLARVHPGAFSSGWTAGFPNGLRKLHVTPVLFQVHPRRIDAQAAPGASGSPVLNAQGEVVGLVSMVWRPVIVNGWGQRVGHAQWSWIIELSTIQLALEQL